MIVPPSPSTSTRLRVTLQEGAARRLLLSSDAVARVVRVFQRCARFPALGAHAVRAQEL